MKSFPKLQPTQLYSIVWAMIVVSMLLLVLASLPGVPTRDSSVYVYIAEGMLNGEVPYVDRWDHKPPLIYLLDLIGLVISGKHLWGIWLLEGLFLVSAVWLAFMVLKTNFGRTAAFFSISMFLLYLNRFIDGGNYTEEYVILLQFLALHLFLRIDKQYHLKPWQPLAIGALAAGAFLLKPNLVGVWLAIGFYWVFSGRKALHCILWSIAGAASVFLILFVVLTSVDAWSAFLDAVFSYNFAYSGSASLKDKINAGLSVAKEIEGFPLVITGWFIGLGYFLLRKTRHDQFEVLLRLAIILLPVEVVLISTSGRQYGHYYLVVLPVITIFLSFFGRVVINVLDTFTDGRRASQKDEFLVQMAATACLLAIVVNTSISYRGTYSDTLSRIRKIGSTGVIMRGDFSQVAEYIRDHTTPNNRILVWGAQAEIYLLSKRQSPTRFFYQYPLVTSNYANDSLFNEFLSDVENHRPEIIIDTRNMHLPPLNSAERLAWQRGIKPGIKPGSKPGSKRDLGLYSNSLAPFQPFFSFVEREYEYIEEVGGCAIYKWKSNSSR